MSDEPLIAVFVDYENLAIGVRDSKLGDFDIELVLKRLLERGRIVFKRAYCDWSQYRSAVRKFHANGIEMIDIPRGKVSGKNSADIRMVVDALDLCYAKHHIDHFALLSGDSDFSPLVSKLKENNKRVVGSGVKASTSDLLIASCDEFMYYDDLVRTVKSRSKRKRRPARAEGNGADVETDAGTETETETDTDADADGSHRREEGVELLAEMVGSLEQDYDPLWGSAIKQAIRRVHPGFSESYYGFRSFSNLLQGAAKAGRIVLEHDEERGNYKVTLPAGD